ncbi:MAG: ABC transporter ATP-binding protein [Ruminococcaceae bacterium]|nr:ABC transporter ATP-binding protein [Oscillospiraceae bacterium]
MIKIDNITMHYGSIRSLHNVTATVHDGSIFGLIGSNGSGKSTLLRILSGIIKPDTGTVTCDDRPVWENPAVKQEILYLSDEQFFLPHSTINDMARLYQTVYPDFSEEVYKKLRDIFTLDCDRKINTFSKGMKKQASVLLAISARPRYLLCDETFDGLDPVVRQLVKRILAEESAERGLTTIIASHNLREVEDICDTVGLLHKSDLLFVRELDDMKSELHKVQAIFEGEFDASILAPMKIIGYSRRGSLVSFVARGTLDEIDAAMTEKAPTFYETVPLTLEEIFISEMEDRGYDFSKLDY